MSVIAAIDTPAQNLAAYIRERLSEIPHPKGDTYLIYEQVIELSRLLRQASIPGPTNCIEAITAIVANPLSDHHTVMLTIQLAQVMQLFCIDIDSIIANIFTQDTLVTAALTHFNEAASDNQELSNSFFV